MGIWRRRPFLVAVLLSLISITEVWLTRPAELHLAQEAEPSSGIELQGRFEGDPPLHYWCVYDADSDERVAQIYSRWGVAPVPPGRYRVTVKKDSNEVPWTEVTVRTNQIVQVNVSSGVELVGRSADEQPLTSWALYSSESQDRITLVYNRWGFTPVPPGRYRLGVRKDSDELTWQEVEVKENESARVRLTSGIELSGRTEEEPPLQSWAIYDSAGNNRSTIVYNRWGFAPLPPGKYVLKVRAGQNEVSWGEYSVLKDEVVDVGVSSGIDLVAGQAPSAVPPLQHWSVYAVPGDERVNRIYSSMGFVPLPAGRYAVGLRWSAESKEQRWAEVEVTQAEVSTVSLSSGIELTEGFESDSSPVSLEVYETETGRRHTPASDNSGFVWLRPGSYTVETTYGSELLRRQLTIAMGEVKTLSFDDLESTGIRTESPEGHNIALYVLGGRLQRATSQLNDFGWSVANLIDSIAFFRVWGGRNAWECYTCGWSSADSTLPQEIVFSFNSEREAQISAVVVNTTSWETREDPTKLPKEVEIWTSSTSADTDFKKVSSAHLARRGMEQVVEFPPTEAKYLKLRILSNYGGAHTQLGEVKIIESSSGDRQSVLHDYPINLALWQLGGVVAGLSSQELTEQHGAYMLFDGGVESGGWKSLDDYLPQEIVLAFKADQEAYIDRLVVDSQNGFEPATWPKRVSVSASTENVLDGFEPVGEFDLKQESGPQLIPVGRGARFVKLRILENYGGPFTSLGEFEAIEGSREGYASILLAEPRADQSVDQPLTDDELESVPEVEPNNSPEQADGLQIGRRTKGVISPLGEDDYFKLSERSEETRVLTLEVAGQPNIRTSIALLDGDGNELKRFEPGDAPTRRLDLTWDVGVGDRLVKVSQPPITIVMVWDTSGSMTDAADDLRSAVEAYLSQVSKDEKLNLVRFSDDVEVLLADFTSDTKALTEASQNKFSVVGGTALQDAIAKAVELLEGVSGNKGIVVMTDGADSVSQLSTGDLWKRLSQNRIRLYAIGLGVSLTDYSARTASRGDRFLRHAADATDGQYFFAEQSEELKDYYLQIAEDLKKQSTYYLLPRVSGGVGYLEVVSTGEPIQSISPPSQVELIFDGSNSMWGQINGRPKIEIAKEVMSNVIQDLPDDMDVSLRVYGHRVRPGQEGACQDSELLVPFSPIDKHRLVEQIRGIQPRGTTPIAYSLEHVVNDFGGVPGGKVVVLVTDGIEECGGDPVEKASELIAQGLNVRLNIVGFDLSDESAKALMRKAAEITGGNFFDATDAGGLRESLAGSLAVSYDVVDSSGARVAIGQVGQQPVELPPGVYGIVIHTADRPIEVQNVRIEAGASARVNLKKEGREIGFRVTQNND